MATRRRKTFINPSSASLEAIQQQFNPQTSCNTNQIKQPLSALMLPTGSCDLGYSPTLRLEVCCRAWPRTLLCRLQGICFYGLLFRAFFPSAPFFQSGRSTGAAEVRML